MNKVFYTLILILAGFCCIDCSTKKKYSNTIDTLSLLKTVLENKEVINNLPKSYQKQNLRIVKNGFLKKEYHFLINTKPVIYSTIDSSKIQYHQSGNPLYFLRIQYMDIDENGNTSSAFGFFSTGTIVKIKTKLIDNKIEIIDLQFLKI